MRTHYNYLIEALMPTDTRKYYVGTRTCDCEAIKDKYYSSSKHMKQWINANGVAAVKKTILAIWPTRELAMEHEIRIHDHFSVHTNDEFFNRARQRSTGFDTAGLPSSFKGKAHSEESKQKLSESCKGRTSAWKGRTCTEEIKQKIRETKASNPYKHSQETLEKMKMKRTCPHCGTTGGGSAMFRYHFDKCGEVV